MAKQKKDAENTVETPEKDVQKVVRDTEPNGQSVLTGAEREYLVIPELAAEIKHNKTELVPKFMDYKEKLSQSNKTIRELAEKYRESLEYNEETGRYVYDDGEVHCEISVTTEISFSVIKAE